MKEIIQPGYQTKERTIIFQMNHDLVNGGGGVARPVRVAAQRIGDELTTSLAVNSTKH